LGRRAGPTSSRRFPYDRAERADHDAGNDAEIAVGGECGGGGQRRLTGQQQQPGRLEGDDQEEQP